MNLKLAYVRGLVAGVALLCGATAAVRGAGVASIERVSVATNGTPGNSNSTGALALSRDGRYVVFPSSANNLYGAFDTNGTADIYLHDRESGVTLPISINDAHQFANGATALNPGISDDGRFILFQTGAANLVANDTNNASDVFIRDTRGRTIRVSLGPAGAQANSHNFNGAISGDGSSVVYMSDATNMVTGDTNQKFDLYRNTLSDNGFGTILVNSPDRISVAQDGSEPNGDNWNPSISRDGTRVAFSSDATNLMTGDSNGASDIFVRDVATNETILVSATPAGAPGNGISDLPVISANGRFVAFVSAASNLVTGDGNNKADVFIRDLEAGTTERVSVGDNNVEGNDASGEVSSSATILAGRPAISEDGRLVAFVSKATNLVTGDTNGFTDVFVRDRLKGTTRIADVAADGTFANGDALNVAISGDGNVVAFDSAAVNLVGGDSTGTTHVYAVRLGTGQAGNEAPVANAGENVSVFEGQTVALNGSNSGDPEGKPITYSWRQDPTVQQPRVTLLDADTATPTFVAPFVAQFETLTFELTVSDGVNDPVTDKVDVSVGAAPPGEITGTVNISGTGEAAVGAKVRVVRDDGQAAPMATVDGGGHFKVSEVRVGLNHVTITLPGYNPIHKDIEIELINGRGSTATDAFLFKKRTATLAGNIFQSNGEPLIGATVTLMSSSGDEIGSSRTDGAGEYRIKNITDAEAGTARAIRISHAGFITWTIGNLRVKPGSTTFKDAQYGNLQVTVDTAPTSLRGKLDGTRVQVVLGNRVVAENRASSEVRTLHFPNVPATNFRIRVANPKLSATQVSAHVRPGETPTKVTVRLTRRGPF